MDGHDRCFYSNRLAVESRVLAVGMVSIWGCAERYSLWGVTIYTAISLEIHTTSVTGMRVRMYRMFVRVGPSNSSHHHGLMRHGGLSLWLSHAQWRMGGAERACTAPVVR